MTSKLSRRDFMRGAAISALGLGSLALAGCQPTVAPAEPQAPAAEGEGAAPAADAITLRWVTNHGAAEMGNFQRVVDNWHDAHPEAKVDFLNIPGGDEYYNAINTQGAGGDLPDVFYCRSMDTQPFASRGWLVNLEPYIEAHGIDKSDFWEAQVPQMSYEGELYALPYDFSDMGFFYNKNIFDELGLDYPSAEWDWTDFASLCEGLVVMDGDKQTRWGSTINLDSWTFLGILAANGGRLWTDDLKECVIDSEENVQTLEMIVEMRKQGVFPQGGVLPQGVNPWSSQLVVLWHDGSWATQGLREQVGDAFDWDVAPMPFGSTGVRAVSAAGGAWSVGVNTAHMEEAVMLCDHVTSTESCNILIAEPVRSIPGRKSSVDLWVKNATSAGLPPPSVQWFADEMPDAFAEPYPPFWKDYHLVWVNRIPPLVNGGGDEELDAKEVLEITRDEIQDLIDLYWQEA